MKRINITEYDWLTNCPRCGWSDCASTERGAALKLLFHAREVHGDASIRAEQAGEHVQALCSADAAEAEAAAARQLQLF